MGVESKVRPISEGHAALRAGEWERARTAFQAALSHDTSPEALEGLSRALWWEGDLEGAVAARERAHAAFKAAGDLPGAVRSALWIAGEYRAVWRNHAASGGWFTRAQRLVERLPPGPEEGWLDLARAERSADPHNQERYAGAALEAAQRFPDGALEVRALARLGLARITVGRVDEGIADLDEAMAAATAEEDPEAIGEAACRVMEAADLLGDLSRFAQWSRVIEGYMARHDHLPLLAFCGTCCGEAFAAGGRFEEAERELLRSIEALERTGHRPRCVHPASRLAELWVRQGRLEEAAAVLEPYMDLPEAVAPVAALHLARDETAAAAAILERRLAQVGERNLLAVPLLSLLAEARARGGDVPGAQRAAERLHEVAEISGLDRVAGLAGLARARALMAGGDAAAAAPELDGALAAFQRAGMPVETAIAHRELARALANGSPELAVQEGRTALRGFEHLGMPRAADETRAFLRRLGVRGQTGPKGVGVLTAREREILELLAAGLTNAEIAGRLYISPKTAANHVSNVLMKLGVRTRTEAAARAIRSVPAGR